MARNVDSVGITEDMLSIIGLLGELLVLENGDN
jgi:hypothetical protein